MDRLIQAVEQPWTNVFKFCKKRFISTNKNLAVKRGEKINKIYFRGSAEEKNKYKKAEKSMSKK